MIHDEDCCPTRYVVDPSAATALLASMNADLARRARFVINSAARPFGASDSVSAGQRHDHNCKPLTCGFSAEWITGRPEAPSFSLPAFPQVRGMIDNFA